MECFHLAYLRRIYFSLEGNGHFKKKPKNLVSHLNFPHRTPQAVYRRPLLWFHCLPPDPMCLSLVPGKHFREVRRTFGIQCKRGPRSLRDTTGEDYATSVAFSPLFLGSLPSCQRPKEWNHLIKDQNLQNR